MTNRPQRPVQHDLKTRSHRAFEQRLPGNWTAQERREDYGIDFDVEIFESGTTSGYRFGTQIKAVGRLRGSPSAQVKWTTRNYWGDQSFPTLVVLWDDHTERLWWCWNHRFDPQGLDRKKPKFAFKFPAKQLWDQHTALSVQREVEAHYAWASPERHLPLSLVTSGRDHIGGVGVGRILSRVSRRLAKFDSLIELRSEPRTALHLALEVAASESVIWLSGGPSLTLHHEVVRDFEDALDEESFISSFSADLVASLAHRLSALRLDQAAARLLATVVEESMLILGEEHAVAVMRILAANGRVAEALTVLKRLKVKNEAIATCALLDLASVLGDSDREKVADTLLSWADELLGSDNSRAGTLTYNASQMLGTSDLKRAIALIDLAADRDPSYRNRDYWWRERAGWCFLSGHITDAIDGYSHAVDLGHPDACHLLADCLIFAGRYREAQEAFQSIETAREPFMREARLKHRAISFLIEKTAIATQQRDPETADQVVNGAGADLDSLRRVLRSDLLNSRALYGIGHDAMADGDLDEAFLWFLSSAVFDPDQPAPWIPTIVIGLALEHDLAVDAALYARRFCGPSIVEFLMEEAPTPDAAGAMQQLFDDLPEEEMAELTVRVIGPGDSEYESVTF